jgi:hypothetical protein
VYTPAAAPTWFQYDWVAGGTYACTGCAALGDWVFGGDSKFLNDATTAPSSATTCVPQANFGTQLAAPGGGAALTLSPSFLAFQCEA